MEIKKESGHGSSFVSSFPLYPELSHKKLEPDDDELYLQSEAGKKLSAREKRQLRNKVSARNFRVRRKEYITHLEGLVAKHSSESASLRTRVARLESENSRLNSDLTTLKMIVPLEQVKEEDVLLPLEQDVVEQVLTKYEQEETENSIRSALATAFTNKDPNPNSIDWPLAYSENAADEGVFDSDWWQKGTLGNGSVQAFNVQIPNFNPKLDKSLEMDDARDIIAETKEEARETTEDSKGDYTDMLQLVGFLYETVAFAVQEHQKQIQTTQNCATGLPVAA